MKNLYRLFFFLMCLFGLVAQAQNASLTITPTPFEENQQVTVTLSGLDPVATWGVTDVYLWMWSFDLNDANILDSPTNGVWTNSNEAQRMTNNGNGTFSFTFTPTTLYQRTGIGRIGILAKAKDGSNGKQTADFLFEVGAFQLSRSSPASSPTVINSGGSVSVQATTTLPANFVLLADGSSINTQNSTSNYSFSVSPTQNTSYELRATEPVEGTVLSSFFDVVISPTVPEVPLPAGLQDGINLDLTNPANPKVTLVLFAPNKSFVHVIGSFNNWQIDNNFLMNKDSAQNRFWIELTGLAAQTDYTYQYLVDASIRVADPYSEVVLNEFDDPFIDAITYPNLPAYPVGQTQFPVTLLRFGDPEFVWTDTSYVKPAQTDLIIYELLIRDFDSRHSFDAVREKLQYFKDLGVNAIELMPVSEFDGNISWGFNPGFHMALDKYYGTKDALKRLVNDAHNMGIAIILDVVYNHATGQNPYFRLWNQCGGDFNCKASVENPFFNVDDPNTTFSFFNDMDHVSTATQAYVDRMNRYWIEAFKVDGYRFDFTKGFTNTVGDGGAFDGSRIGILRRMNAALKSVHPDAYVILEHFAPNSEEDVLEDNFSNSFGFTGNFSGMMLWGNHNFNYGETVLGFNDNDANFSGISWKNRGWEKAHLVGYSESHDEERQMWRAANFGNSFNAAHDVKNQSIALQRMATMGAVLFTIPGPKMLWQFGELGYDFSINTCPDLSINNNCRVDPKPIRLDYAEDPERAQVYKDWAKVLFFRNNLPIFKTSNFTVEAGFTNGIKKIFLVDDAVTNTASELKYLTVVANFDVVTQTTQPFFQETGDWFDYANNNALLNVTNTAMSITLQPGEYRIYGNIAGPIPPVVNPTLSFDDIEASNIFSIKMYPNPASDAVSFSQDVARVSVFDITGRRILQTSELRTNQSLEVSGLRPGVYLVKFEVNGRTETKKLIKR
ncbi:MAG: alpha-amylase family glycosyl hydrolase [Flavobacteriaceae bacterium]|nr:alpha-amylase family glycosyl hydrolase [Flavobacteriaceae bacterium]